jgi:hypothetical protein
MDVTMRHTEPPASLFDSKKVCFLLCVAFKHWTSTTGTLHHLPQSINLLLVPVFPPSEKCPLSARFRIPQQPPTGLEPSLAANPRPTAHLPLAHLCALGRLGGGSLLLQTLDLVLLLLPVRVSL